MVSTDPGQLALLSGTAPRKASAAARTLLRDADPLIVLHSSATAAPACWLRIPQAYREAAAWHRRRAESITPAHPASLALGHAAPFTYGSLTSYWQTVPQTADAARLSRSGAAGALPCSRLTGSPSARSLARPSGSARHGAGAAAR